MSVQVSVSVTVLAVVAERSHSPCELLQVTLHRYSFGLCLRAVSVFVYTPNSYDEQGSQMWIALEPSYESCGGPRVVCGLLCPKMHILVDAAAPAVLHGVAVTAHDRLVATTYVPCCKSDILSRTFQI